MKKIFIVFALFCVFSCNNKQNDEKLELGKYVYLDKDSTIHSKKGCLKFMLEEQKDFGVKRILADGINPKYLEKTCSYCVTDEIYEKLESIKGEEVADSTDWSQYEVK